MRTRVIRPAAFSDEAIGQLPGMQFKAILGLICMAGPQGRLELKPLQIMARLFPYEKFDLDNKILGPLEKAGLIQRYSVGDTRYIQVAGMRDKNSPLYQSWNVNEESVLPGPGEGALEPHRPSEEKAETPKTVEKTKPNRKPKTPKEDSALYTERFLALWELSNKKEGRKVAAERFAALAPSDEAYEGILSAWKADNARWRSEGRETSKCPGLGPWINQERWRDREPPASGPIVIEPPMPPPEEEYFEPDLTEEEKAIIKAQLSDTD